MQILLREYELGLANPTSEEFLLSSESYLKTESNL